jgi:hypothetical protein
VTKIRRRQILWYLDYDEATGDFYEVVPSIREGCWVQVNLRNINKIRIKERFPWLDWRECHDLSVILS